MLKPVRTSAPAVLPVSVDEVKLNLRVDSTAEDDMIQALIETAVEYLDGYSGILGRALITQTWAQKYPAFPLGTDVIGLEVAPVQSITSVTYYDEDNVQQTLAGSGYAFLEDELGSFLSLPVDYEWPDTYEREDAVTVTYVAGYGDDGTYVPARIRHAIKLLVGEWYVKREASTDSTISSVSRELPFGVSNLLSAYRRVGF